MLCFFPVAYAVHGTQRKKRTGTSRPRAVERLGTTIHSDVYVCLYSQKSSQSRGLDSVRPFLLFAGGLAFTLSKLVSLARHFDLLSKYSGLSTDVRAR